MRELEGKSSTLQTVSLLGEEVNMQQMSLPHLLGIQSQMRDDMNRINTVRATACVASFNHYCFICIDYGTKSLC